METYKKLLMLKEKHNKPTPKPIEEQQLKIDKQQTKGPPDISSGEISKGNCIGKGTFGVVFEGKCREQPVAIKVLHEQNWDEKKLNIFKQEVEVLSQIYHPNICLFMGACFESGNMMIISELLPKGDMEKILRNKNIPLSLNQRILMARDAARGMAWLHYGDTVFIHRDLKPGNLLIDENWRVKVCDFGLTQIAKQGEKLTDGRDGAKGTPLYMAPEVLSGKGFTSAADVYSFGVILWEIYTREPPYKQFKNYVDFKDQICNHNFREKLPNDCPKRLAKLIELCWDGNPESRPNFADIIDTLEDVLIDITITDPDGAAFWRKYFKGKTSVNWEEFIDKFLIYLKIEKPKEVEIEKLSDNPSENEIMCASRKQLNELSERSPEFFEAVVKEMNRRASTGEDIMDTEEDEDDMDLIIENFNTNLKCFNVVLNRGNKCVETEEVTIENFGSILNYFGPIVDKNTTTPFLDKIRNVLSQAWFHGDLDTREAERLLGGRSFGTYLVRFSTSAPGGFTISKVSKNNITHQRIQHNDNGFSIGNNNIFPTLELLIDASRSDLHLDQSCPGSKFNQLFESNVTDGYISNYK